MNKTPILSLLLTALFFVTAAPAQRVADGTVETTIKKVTVFGSKTVIPAAGSQLSRNNVGVYWDFSTSSLPVGEAVTLWVAIFNNPAYCASTPCAPADLNNPFVYGSLQFAGGSVVGVNGRADYSGYLAAGDNSGYYILFPSMANPAPGIEDPRRAEIHLVMRKHGPASSDPVVLQQQLSSFTGGCGVAGACANIQASIHEP